jgi:hypothetical protein
VFTPHKGAEVGIFARLRLLNDTQPAPREWTQSWRAIRETGWFAPISAGPKGQFTLGLWWSSFAHRALCIVRAADLDTLRPRAPFDVETDSSVVARQLLLGPEDNRSFSSAARVLALDGLAPRVLLTNDPLIVEPVDQSIWAWNGSHADPQLVRLEFGGETAYERLDYVIPGARNRRDPPRESLLAVWCAKGVFVCEGGRFVPWVAADGAELASKFVHAVPITLGWLDADALEPQVAVRNQVSGELVLEHAYTVPSDISLATALAASVAQAPLAGVVSYLTTDPAQARHSTWRGNPLLNNRSRPWLLAFNLAVAAFLAALAWHRYSQPRARTVRWVWTITTLLFGIPAVLARLLVEPSAKTEVPPQVRRVPAPFLLHTTEVLS